LTSSQGGVLQQFSYTRIHLLLELLEPTAFMRNMKEKIKPEQYPLFRRYGMAACFSVAHPSKRDSSPQTILKAFSTAL
jgi:hypothetical protein